MGAICVAIHIYFKQHIPIYGFTVELHQKKSTLLKLYSQILSQVLVRVLNDILRYSTCIST